MRLLNIMLSFLILIGSSILGVVLPYREGNSLWTVLSILWLFVEPTKFFYRKNYKRVISSWYLFLLGILEVIILFFMIFRTTFSFWIIYISVFMLIIFQVFMKKEPYTRDFDISKLLLFMITIMAFSTYFNQINLSMFGMPLGMTLSIFSFLLIFLIDRISGRQSLRSVYLFLMLFALISKQPICFILLIRLFLDLDSF